MRVAYFDCFAGASGDMILGALLDAGLELGTLKSELAKLKLSHYDIELKKVVKRGIGGSQAVISIEHDHHSHHHRHLHDIKEIIGRSDLAEPIKKQALQIFTRLAEAEAKVHRTSIENIHFHEVGAMDAILDVVGSVAGLAALGVQRICCSPFHLGSGTIECAHGVLPVPAPATAELIRGKPAYATDVVGELLTPTGAAILTTLSSDFGPLPNMTVECIGYGAGTSDPPVPNLLRVIIGNANDEIEEYQHEGVGVLETNIDDMNPQMYDYVIEQMLLMGALDVFLGPIQMKKSRPGTLVTVVCPEDKVGRFADFLMRETTTIGLRWRVDNRIKAARSFREVETKYGRLTLKIAEAGGKIINATPEYEDCKKIALKHGVPLKEVMEEARTAAAAFLGGNPR